MIKFANSFINKLTDGISIQFCIIYFQRYCTSISYRDLTYFTRKTCQDWMKVNSFEIKKEEF